MLATWRWMSCRCNGFITRKPCFDCKRVGMHIASFSKVLCHMDKNGVLTIDQSNRNKHLVWVNGKQQIKNGAEGGQNVSVQLREGDILQFGRYCSSAWMTFYVETNRVVTPEVKSRVENRRKSSNLTSNSQEENNDVCPWFEEKFEMGLASCSARKKSIWLQATKRKGQYFNGSKSRESLDCEDEIDHSSPNVISPVGRKIIKRSSISDTSGSADVLHLKNEDNKKENFKVTKSHDEASDNVNKWSIHRRKRKHTLPLFSAMKRIKQREPWHDESDASSNYTIAKTLFSVEDKDEKQSTHVKKTTDVLRIECETLASISSICRKQRTQNRKEQCSPTPNCDTDEKSSERSSIEWKKSSLATQNEKQEPGSHREGSMLFLPECPTYDSNSAVSVDDSGSKKVEKIRKENIRDDTKTIEYESASASLDRKRTTRDLNSQDWRNMQTIDGETGSSLVHRSLSKTVTEQRLQLKEKNWLPEILQNTIVGVGSHGDPG